MRPCGECGAIECGCYARRRWLIAVEAGHELLRDLQAKADADAKTETDESVEEIGEMARSLARA